MPKKQKNKSAEESGPWIRRTVAEDRVTGAEHDACVLEVGSRLLMRGTRDAYIPNEQRPKAIVGTRHRVRRWQTQPGEQTLQRNCLVACN
jgi:hypothetical protein